MNISEDYILINYNHLAHILAEQEWKWRFEERYPFKELYEQVDDSGHWYMKNEYNSIYSAIENRWRQELEEMDIIHSID